MTLAGINIDLPAAMKEIRQTGFPIVLVGFIGLGMHHWATRYFDEVVVPESKSKIALVDGVIATNLENSKNLARITEALDRHNARADVQAGGWPLFAAATVIDRREQAAHHKRQQHVEQHAGRFDLGEHGLIP